MRQSHPGLSSGRALVVLSRTVETIHRYDRWLPGRWLNGDETVQNARVDPEQAGLYLQTFGIYGYSVFQRE